jgi:ATP-dependent exoDNAse (exonuclease V) beta subunit
MLGYTQKEFESNFAEHIENLVKSQGLDRKELLDKLREWYNGYRFEEDADTVYNPVSIGMFIEAEARTSIGRIDAVAQTEKYVYIFEFKLNRSADEGLKQIHDKTYYQKYLGSGREIILVGANFSTESRNIGEWKTEVLT